MHVYFRLDVLQCHISAQGRKEEEVKGDRSVPDNLGL